MDRRRVLCVGAVVRDEEDRLLVVRRGRPPDAGRWSLPGGRVEPGESAPSAAVREVAEETGLAVAAGRLLGSVERPGPGGVTYLILDYVCTPCAPDRTPRAGDDAADARWVSPAELAALPTTPGLLEALRGWGVLD
ncbi:ADP-ribose pyrophosphatase YjhB, NUDIX family [Actinopolymorpha cephalotaxi]|uniref:ADP-ribose pyrophosphatase YjhB (NUDIX family) n=1 Tax=Actinopolymorpha cephalotaxi TaxID=504797 RepID=A0A1I2YYE1_9ACTN|nr:NUDIX hydrolase [Actinopolymorpha cephalotaxi]NYH81770.1 ADP-ribose pyrophosphatase YjhB (NUDIX family) [Actinopolymorpha cephalotaxi]SFH30613.1 ADP-ribose pyrophosphatase YjhB, NUDIX family [Actinopolymorpha cephalotaxi]